MKAQSDLVYIPANELRAWACTILVDEQVPEPEAKYIAHCLVEADLAGHHSHGVVQLLRYVPMVREKRICPNAKTTVIRETSTTATLNGNWGFGQIIARTAVQLAISKARSVGPAIVTVQQSNHIGRLADFAVLAAQADMIGIMTANGHGGGLRVAPWNGCGPHLHTNPLCVAIPSHNCPLVLDMATSAVAEGKVRLAKYCNEAVPLGWLTDASGQATTNPNVLYTNLAGALLPLGGVSGYKGYGLSLIVDILSGGLSDAACSESDNNVRGNAFFFLAINISHFVKVADFKDRVSALINHVKSAQPVKNAQDILIPGELENQKRSQYLKSGIPLSNQIWTQLQGVASEPSVSTSGYALDHE